MTLALGIDVGGTKIAAGLVDADSGIVYERRLEPLIDRLERLPVATIAEVDGAAAGTQVTHLRPLSRAC